MQLSWLSLLAAFVLLVFGLVEYALLRRFLYVRLRQRFEAAKVTQSQGLDPDVLWGIVKFVSLIVLPVLGLVFGHAVLAPFFA